MTKHTLILVLAAAVSAAGCEQALGLDEALGPEELAELSDILIQDGLTETADTSTAGMDAAGTAGARLAGDAVTSSTAFTRTRTCALGGEVVMSGTRTRTRDTETRTGTMEVNATRTFLDCARPLADSTVTLTLNGEVTLDATREWQARQWRGTQEISLSGTMDWVTSDDRSGSCLIDIQAGFDPDTRQRTVTGSVCGEDVSELDGWTFGTGAHAPGHRSGQGPHGDPAPGGS